MMKVIKARGEIVELSEMIDDFTEAGFDVGVAKEYFYIEHPLRDVQDRYHFCDSSEVQQLYDRWYSVALQLKYERCGARARNVFCQVAEDVLVAPNWLTSVQMVWKDVEHAGVVGLRVLDPGSVPIGYYVWSTEELRKLAEWLTEALDGAGVGPTPLELFNRALEEGLIREDYELPDTSVGY